MPAIVPTGGLEPKLGTNPIAFGAPSARGKPFLLDMATSTAAIGKLKLAQRAETELPEGWALTREGAPQRDPTLALLDPLLAPLGGHKGYGLATMVEVLSSVLSGAALTPLRGEPGQEARCRPFRPRPRSRASSAVRAPNSRRTSTG